ncbi:MAG: MG2 domain-containing protein [Myxococcaceae bacterium]
MKKRWWIALAILALIAFVISRSVCLRTGFGYGLWLDQCPDGELKQTISLSAPAIGRGGESEVSVQAFAHYTTGESDNDRAAALSNFKAELYLVQANTETALTPKKGWNAQGTVRTAKIELPKVNDGEYQLRAKVHSALGESTLDVPLPLYTPARIHVLTDRPLYEPGNTVKFRAVVLKAVGLSPLDERPGVWRVYDNRGELQLEEKAPAGSWGVVSGSFPLDKSAESGTWRVDWTSGSATSSRSFEVKPFTLPRFKVETDTGKPFYLRHERPMLKGDVKYSSGAPVAKAKVEVSWNVAGEWPAPTSWLEHDLPKAAVCNDNGHFELQLPAVPDDLLGQATLMAHLSLSDSSGDRIESNASVLLTEDAIKVTAITELNEGLVEGYNNRVYLRATTADGRVLPGAVLNIKRLWEPTDKGVDAEADSDGVASLQLDPGPAVNVEIPPMPFRPPQKAKPVTRQSVMDHLDQETGEASLADRLSLDRFESSLSSCNRFASNPGEQVLIGLRVSAGGKIAGQAVSGGRIGKCVGDALGRLSFGAGKERMLELVYSFDDSDLPRLSADPETVPDDNDEIATALSNAMPDVRDCLPFTAPSEELSQMISLEKKAGSREVAISWIPDPQGAHHADGALGCIKSRLTKLKLPKLTPADPNLDDDAANGGQDHAFVGIARLQLTAPEKYESVRPQATVMLGYQFKVSARVAKEKIGDTKLLVHPGAVPPLRLRLASQLVRPGAKVEAELLRGPDFQGDLPKEAYLTLGRDSKKADLDEKTRKVSFELPADFEGWGTVTTADATAYFFVQPKSQLSLELKPEKDRYTPGQEAKLLLATRIGGTGAQAAVGLFGVDESLGQLTALPGADEMSGLRPQVSSSGNFDGLDAQALTMGRVRGPNAQAATLLKVTALPPLPELEPSLTLNGTTLFDPISPLTDHFYTVLEELHVQTRQWESSAPEGEKMKPATMAKLWTKALDAVETKKGDDHDAYGRRLKLSRLPADLLALTDPRSVVVNATRLPEDTENWSQWVAKEKP